MIDACKVLLSSAKFIYIENLTCPEAYQFTEQNEFESKFVAMLP